MNQWYRLVYMSTLVIHLVRYRPFGQSYWRSNSCGVWNSNLLVHRGLFRLAIFPFTDLVSCGRSKFLPDVRSQENDAWSTCSSQSYWSWVDQHKFSIYRKVFMTGWLLITVDFAKSDITKHQTCTVWFSVEGDQKLVNHGHISRYVAHQ